ncbi:MAG: hypothetical protein HC878_20820, partial [Leptolyngbyaceae cyanobacterium SL_5_14]|nr:hypothetical protein [Leptolyngbyaceae cyanobacterium SL_5_14]
MHEVQHKVGEVHLEQVHRELQEKYSEFWYEDKLSISHAIDLLETTSESNNEFSVLDPLVIARKLQLPEEQRRKNYSSSKPVRRKKMFRGIWIVIISLLLIGISGIWLNSQPTSICMHTTQVLPIEFKDMSEQGELQRGNESSSADDLAKSPEAQSPAPTSQTSSNPANPSPSSPEVLLGVEGLTQLRKEHETASIWISGSLTVDESFADQIREEIKEQTEKQTIDRTEITISLDVKDSSKLNIKNHPIDFAIALLENQKEKITSGKLDATIVEPILPEQSSCNCETA